MRKFKSGAIRDDDNNKIDYEGFLSPLVIERFGEYMHKHRVQSDGNLRSSDNWQKGFGKDVVMKSMWRHFFSVWKSHRKGEASEEELCALLFNVMAYLHEELKD